MIEVARGSRAAHAAGFINRCISRETSSRTSGHHKIADFGPAKPLSGAGGSMTGEGVVLGTPMLHGARAGRAEKPSITARLYALGCSFFHSDRGHGPVRRSNKRHRVLYLLEALHGAGADHAETARGDIHRRSIGVVVRLVQKDLPRALRATRSSARRRGGCPGRRRAGADSRFWRRRQRRSHRRSARRWSDHTARSDDR